MIGWLREGVKRHYAICISHHQGLPADGGGGGGGDWGREGVGMAGWLVSGCGEMVEWVVVVVVGKCWDGWNGCGGEMSV